MWKQANKSLIQPIQNFSLFFECPGGGNTLIIILGGARESPPQVFELFFDALLNVQDFKVLGPYRNAFCTP